MAPKKLLFSYGLDLNLDLLHGIIGGPRPICRGVATLNEHKRVFSACGHLPNLAKLSPSLVNVEGALTELTPEQWNRVEAWLLCPMLYVPSLFTVNQASGRERKAWVFIAGPSEGPWRPSHTEWEAMMIGARQRGLSSRTLASLEAYGHSPSPWPYRALAPWAKAAPGRTRA